MQKKVAVVLSGCGVQDGAEIHEAVITLLTLDRAGAAVQCAAPDVAQTQVVNHLRGAPVPGESRNVLVESARIARGAVVDLSRLHAQDVDAAVFPGGFGAALNLCSYGTQGREMHVHPEVARFILELQAAGKPLGFLCIAPVLAAKVLGPQGVQLTVGNDAGTAADMESWGARHVDTPVDGIVVDERLKVVSTPAYMLAEHIAEAATGIEKLVAAVLRLA